MEQFFQSPWTTPFLVLAGSVLLGYLSRALVLRWLSHLFRRTRSEIDDLLLAALRPHIPFWFLLGGLGLAARLAPIQPRMADLVQKVCAAGFALSLSLAVAAFGSGLLGHFSRRASVTVAGTSLSQNILRGVILSLGGLLVLSNLGISITPLLTALGVGSLAVALALQPTLSNLFAGVQISLSKPIRVGDFVELESGPKGHVEDIGWRYTRIRALSNNVVIVPNGRVSEMVLTNHSLPEPEQSAPVQVGVSYGSDLEKVERVTCEVAREVLREVEGGIPQFEPFIRYHTFGESSINFTVILRVKSFPELSLVVHEFVKRLKARYDAEGIEIPFPQRVVHAAAPGPESSPGRPPTSGGGMI